MEAIRYSLLALGVAVVFLLVPSASEACPKCFASTSNQVLHAYYVSAAFMILIPFGIVGSMVAWLYFRQRQICSGRKP